MPDNVQHSDAHTGKKEHILYRPILDAVRSNATPEEIAESVLVGLDQRGLIQYTPKDVLSLMSATGRVLICLMENPGSTIRDIAVRIGVTEANVGKSISTLAEHKLITRTKVGAKYKYNFSTEAITTHPDIQRFFACIAPFFKD